VTVHLDRPLSLLGQNLQNPLSPIPPPPLATALLSYPWPRKPLSCISPTLQVNRPRYNGTRRHSNDSALVLLPAADLNTY
jgi:hypothetical protein